MSAQTNTEADTDLVRVRRRGLTVETIFHEFGPAPEVPVRLACATAVVANRTPAATSPTSRTS